MNIIGHQVREWTAKAYHRGEQLNPKWFSDRETFPQEITHPVVADTNHGLSRAFGIMYPFAGNGVGRLVKKLERMSDVDTSK